MANDRRHGLAADHDHEGVADGDIGEARCFEGLADLGSGETVFLVVGAFPVPLDEQSAWSETPDQIADRRVGRQK